MQVCDPIGRKCRSPVHRRREASTARDRATGRKFPLPVLHRQPGLRGDGPGCVEDGVEAGLEGALVVEQVLLRGPPANLVRSSSWVGCGDCRCWSCRRRLRWSRYGSARPGPVAAGQPGEQEEHGWDQRAKGERRGQLNARGRGDVGSCVLHLPNRLQPAGRDAEITLRYFNLGARARAGVI